MSSAFESIRTGRGRTGPVELSVSRVVDVAPGAAVGDTPLGDKQPAEGSLLAPRMSSALELSAHVDTVAVHDGDFTGAARSGTLEINPLGDVKKAWPACEALGLNTAACSVLLAGLGLAVLPRETISGARPWRTLDCTCCGAATTLDPGDCDRIIWKRMFSTVPYAMLSLLSATALRRH